MSTRTNRDRLTTFNNKRSVEIFDVHYQMAFGNPDVYRWCGYCPDHSGGSGQVMPGFPVSFDKESEIIETTRTIYKISGYGMPKEKFWDQINNDFNNGGFETK